MTGEYSTIAYFFDLLSLAVVLMAIVWLPLPSAVKRLAFALAGAYLLFLIAPRLLAFYTLAWLTVFVLQRVVVWSAEKSVGLTLLWVGIALLLAPMIVWKLWFSEFNVAFNLWGNGIVEWFGPRLWTIDLAREIIIPIGLSFATFRAIDLLIKSYLGQVGALSLDRVLFYGFFPPVQVIGPVIQYTEIQQQGDQFLRPQAADVYQGVLRIFTGIIKVALIAVALQPSAAVFNVYENESPLHLWLLLFTYTWYFYINFSGYSDLAIGTARLFGFELNENFKYPYFRKNVADYWNNWHMSLSHFAQRNVYVPMGGYRVRTQYIALFATIMVIALWHNITWGMVLFGCYHGAGLMAHRYWSTVRQNNTGPEALWQGWGKIAATYIFVTLGFPLLVMPLSEAIHFYGSLTGL